MGFAVSVAKDQIDNTSLLFDQTSPLCREIKESDSSLIFFPNPGKLIELLKALTALNLQYEMKNLDKARLD